MELRVLIDSLDTAHFTCPGCTREKVMQVSEYDLKNQATRVKYRCKCGHTCIIILEKKYKFIQNIHLLGTFFSKGSHTYSGKMTIKKLNNKGLMLKTNIEQKLLPGLKLFLEFVLDDAKQSIVKKEVIVRAKKGVYLSAEFTSDEHYDNLGPYLYFNKLYI